MCAAAGDWAGAEAALERMGPAGGGPPLDGRAWTLLVHAYKAGGELEKALAVPARMEAAGLPPNALTYAAVLKARPAVVFSGGSCVTRILPAFSSDAQSTSMGKVRAVAASLRRL